MVYSKGLHSSAIFFVTKGRVSFCLEEESDIGFLDMIMGSYFGEIEVIKSIPRLFSVKAAEHTDFLTLSKQVFELYLMNEYPATFEEMSKVAILRQEKITIAEQIALDTVGRVQYHDVANMSPEDFDRLLRPSAKNLEGKLKSGIVTLRAQQTARSSRLKKSQSVRAPSARKPAALKGAKKAEESSSVVSDSGFGTSSEASPSQSGESGSSDASKKQPRPEEGITQESAEKKGGPSALVGFFSSLTKAEPAEREAERPPNKATTAAFSPLLGKDTAGAAAAAGPRMLRRAQSQSAAPRVAPGDRLLDALGAGMLENLGEAIQKKQEDEEEKVRDQQREYEKRAQMLKKLEHLKRTRLPRLASSTLE